MIDKWEKQQEREPKVTPETIHLSKEILETPNKILKKRTRLLFLSQFLTLKKSQTDSSNTRSQNKKLKNKNRRLSSKNLHLLLLEKVAKIQQTKSSTITGNGSK